MDPNNPRTEPNAHYDKAYFNWQQFVGEFGGTANLIKFQDLIRPRDTVVDFGAGGGFLLSRINCAEKIGVEINPNARASAESRGLKMLPELDDVPDNYADVIISNHALEHTDYPLGHLRLALNKVKPGGLAVFVIPCEQAGYQWTPNDINFHIHSWGPMSLGNLFVRAGFEVVESKAFFTNGHPISRAFSASLAGTHFILFAGFMRTWTVRRFRCAAWRASQPKAP